MQCRTAAPGNHHSLWARCRGCSGPSTDSPRNGQACFYSPEACVRCRELLPGAVAGSCLLSVWTGCETGGAPALIASSLFDSVSCAMRYCTFPMF